MNKLSGLIDLMFHGTGGIEVNESSQPVMAHLYYILQCIVCSIHQ